MDNKNGQSEELLNAQEAPLHEIKLWKRITLFLIGFLGLHLFALVVGIIVSIVCPKDLVNPVTNLISYGVLFVSMIAIIVVDLPKLLYHFKKWKPYVFGLAGAIAIVLFEIAYTNILNLFYKYQSSGNEEGIRSIVLAFPVASVFMLGIVGPICEELAYRVGLFAALSKYRKWLAYVVTSLVFGAIHIVGSLITGASVWNELANLPVYVIAGLAFSFLYDKWGFASSTTAHISNNLYAVLATIISNSIKG